MFTVNKEIKVTDAQKNQTYKNISVGMTYYTAMSPASNMVSYTDKVSVPRVYTKAGKNSIKLSFTREAVPDMRFIVFQVKNIRK